MSECLWYQSYQDGEPPRMRRFSRLPISVQWSAVIDLAISLAENEASYRVVFHSITHEQYWWWPRGDRTIPDPQASRSCRVGTSAWWMITHRAVTRAYLVRDAAVHAETRAPGGPPHEFWRRVARRLERWRQTGHWRRIAAQHAPRRPPQPKRPRGRPRKGTHPARKPRPLPAMQGTALRQLRIKLGLTQDQVATVLGIGRGTIWGIEQGRSYLPVGTAVRWLERAVEASETGATGEELAEMARAARVDILVRPALRRRKVKR